ncbi:hypothetical protein ACQZV8_13285 [Magnetococcales bacterium HHB-1]
MNFKRAYRTNGLSLCDKVGLFSGDTDPSLGDSQNVPVGSLYLRTNGMVYRKRALTEWEPLSPTDKIGFHARHIRRLDYLPLLGTVGVFYWHAVRSGQIFALAGQANKVTGESLSFSVEVNGTIPPDAALSLPVSIDVSTGIDLDITINPGDRVRIQTNDSSGRAKHVLLSLYARYV